MNVAQCHSSGVRPAISKYAAIYPEGRILTSGAKKTMNTLFYRDWQENNDAVVLKLEISNLEIKWIFNISNKHGQTYSCIVKSTLYWYFSYSNMFQRFKSHLYDTLLNPACFNTSYHFNNTLLNPTCFNILNQHFHNALLTPKCFSPLNHHFNNILLNPTCFSTLNHHFINTFWIQRVSTL